MPVTVIVGGQFGSEGKGKVAHYLAREQHATIAVRVGGSNSGHTVIDKSGVPRVFRVLPTPALLDDVVCVLGAGSYIDVDVLLAELTVARLPPERLLIDPDAYVITDEHKRIENQWGLRERIGSTGSGTGAAAIDRITGTRPHTSLAMIGVLRNTSVQPGHSCDRPSIVMSVRSSRGRRALAYQCCIRRITRRLPAGTRQQPASSPRPASAPLTLMISSL